MFVCVPLVPMSHPRMHDEAMHNPLPGYPVPACSSNVGYTDGSAPELERMCGRSGSTTEQQIKDI